MTRADLARPAAGLRVLLVEDETVIAFMVEDMLADLGADTVLHAASLERARALIAQSPPDLAVLDINLGRETCLPLAESLRETATPIVFASGYGAAGLPQGWEDAVIIQKPFRQQVLALALRTALLRARGEPD